MRLVNSTMAMACVCGAATMATAGDWFEIIDAPYCPDPTGQITVGVGSLDRIYGFGEWDSNFEYDADLYCVYIDGDFSASTIGGATWDTMLGLFDANCVNLLAFNDDSAGTFQSYISGTVAAGTYILAITRFADFSFTGSSSGTSEYRIELTGMSYCVPAPGAFAVLSMGGLVAVRRRR